MSDVAIKVEHLSKQYRLGVGGEGYRTFRETLVDAVKAPFQQVGNAWRRAKRAKGSEQDPKLSAPSSELSSRRDDYIWALKDVSFEVKQGEVVGIIGRNGAGKSTLLKILSKITEPTEGRVELRGRIGSLLEIGTGFHPELTGHENVYLYGAILGMDRWEVSRKFDEIVAFAELEKFIDTPVKRYSSGMYMRLAFAVAAHLEPEILLVDEVLAVGDAAFQKKCLGKMGDVSKEGRTVLFVSHNMAAINQLCSRTILLEGGHSAADGSTSEVVAKYLNMHSQTDGERVWSDSSNAPGNEKVRLHAIRVSSDGEIKTEVDIDKDVSIDIEFWNFVPDIRNLCVNIYLLDSVGNIVLSTANTSAANLIKDSWFNEPHQTGLFQATCVFPANFLNESLYYLSIYIVTLGPINVEMKAEQILSFRVNDTGVMREPGVGSRWDGVVRVRLPWQTKFVKQLENALSEG